MGNPLSDDDKKLEKNGTVPTAAAPTPAADFSGKEVGAYAKQAVQAPDLSEEAWNKGGEAWKDSVKGRALIRAFSRGVMGASAFAVATVYAGKKMGSYHPDKPIENWVQGIARFYDVTFGKPIKGAVNLMGKDGDRFVNSFRPSIYFPSYGGKPGRSLGHEVVMVTFDFASMSIGDFWGRKIMHTLDPKKERPAWKRKDGSIDWDQALKTFGKNWWTAITYSAGEDWAVAVPYVLTMRHVGTPIVNKLIPGYRYDFDINGVGGGIKINEQGRITGNFTTAGVINLWERFTTYNVGTLIFREAYHWIGSRVNHVWKHHEMPGIVEQDPLNPHRTGLQTVADGATQLANWLTRSTVKAVMYMIPAVPFFWVTRVAQHKFRGPLIHPEKGPLMYMRNGKTLTAVHAATIASPHHPNTKFTDPHFTAQTPVFHFKSHHTLMPLSEQIREPAVNPFIHGPIDPHAKTWGFADTLLTPIGKAADTVREKLRGPVGELFGGGADGRTRAGTYMLASMAYTPYFWAKSDWLADKWDTGKMDVALDRTIAGAVHLNPGEFKAGTREVWQSLWHKPFADPKRELYAQCRDITDKTPSDNKFDINPNEGESCDALFLETKKPKKLFAEMATPKARLPELAAAKPELSWSERMVTGKPEGKLESDANKRKSHSEKEELRKLLEQSTPPTNSVH